MLLRPPTVSLLILSNSLYTSLVPPDSSAYFFAALLFSIARQTIWPRALTTVTTIINSLTAPFARVMTAMAQPRVYRASPSA